MARTPTTADVFNAVAEERRRDILDVLFEGDAAVGDLVERLDLAQSQVSKHLRVLREVGLVQCDRSGRRRIYRIDGAALRPLHDWVGRFERLWNERYDRLDDLLVELQRDEPGHDHPDAEEDH